MAGNSQTEEKFWRAAVMAWVSAIIRLQIVPNTSNILHNEIALVNQWADKKLRSLKEQNHDFYHNCFFSKPTSLKISFCVRPSAFWPLMSSRLLLGNPTIAIPQYIYRKIYFTTNILSWKQKTTEIVENQGLRGPPFTGPDQWQTFVEQVEGRIPTPGHNRGAISGPHIHFCRQCALWQGWASSHQLREMQPGGGRWQWGWRSRWGRRGGRSGWPPSKAQAGPEEADVMASKQQAAAQ